MAEKKRFLDVWIVDISKVYQEVPFSVVADWIQQGRLLADDRARPSGTAEWQRLGDLADFAPYLPKPEPHRADDQAEALEPVTVGFAPSRRVEAEDDDVDMIPLIDVSLVLLIFFMMTAGGGAAPYPVQTPDGKNGSLVDRPEGLTIYIDYRGQGTERRPVYAVGVGNSGPKPDCRDLASREDLLRKFDENLDELFKQNGRIEVTINAHEDLPSGLVRDLTVELESRDRRGKIFQKFIGISEKAS